jgi:hypothetical protein
MKRAYVLRNSSFCNFLDSPDTSSPSGANYLLSALFSNMLNPFPSLRVGNEVSQPFKITGKILVLYRLF